MQAIFRSSNNAEMVVVIDLVPYLLYRRYPGARVKKSSKLSLARLTGRDKMKLSQTRPRAKPLAPIMGRKDEE